MRVKEVADGGAHTHQGASGRDHNPNGITGYLAGAGVKRADSHGATDEFGYPAVESVCTIYDLHATILHLLGIGLAAEVGTRCPLHVNWSTQLVSNGILIAVNLRTLFYPYRLRVTYQFGVRVFWQGGTP
jgi:hypothetical protein